jgi:hypothetical protein
MPGRMPVFARSGESRSGGAAARGAGGGLRGVGSAEGGSLLELVGGQTSVGPGAGSIPRGPVTSGMPIWTSIACRKSSRVWEVFSLTPRR